MSTVLVCQFCGSKDFEKMSDQEFICKACGYGWNGKQANIENTLATIVLLSKYTMLKNPHATKGQIVEMVVTKLHHIENHPLRKDGFCEYCGRLY